MDDGALVSVRSYIKWPFFPFLSLHGKEELPIEEFGSIECTKNRTRAGGGRV